MINYLMALHPELLAGRFAPEVPAQPIRRLCLLGEQRAADATLEAELRWLEEEPSALIMAVRTGSRRMEYFPDAMVAVAELSMIGNEQHNPGKPLHWDRSKSGDELDALTRHLIDAGTLQTTAGGFLGRAEGGGFPDASRGGDLGAKTGDRRVVRRDRGELGELAFGSGVVASIAKAEGLGHEANFPVFIRGLRKEVTRRHCEGHREGDDEQAEERPGEELGFHDDGK